MWIDWMDKLSNKWFCAADRSVYNRHTSSVTPMLVRACVCVGGGMSACCTVCACVSRIDVGVISAVCHRRRRGHAAECRSFLRQFARRRHCGVSAAARPCDPGLLDGRRLWRRARWVVCASVRRLSARTVHVRPCVSTATAATTVDRHRPTGAPVGRRHCRRLTRPVPPPPSTYDLYVCRTTNQMRYVTDLC